MKEKVIIAILCFLIGFSSALAFTPAKEIFSNKKEPVKSQAVQPSEYDKKKKGKTYNDVINQDKPILAMFYVDWCGWCKRYVPSIEQLRKKYKNKLNIIMINCEDEKNKALVKEFGVKGYPTLYIIDTKSNLKKRVENRDVDVLSIELDKILETRN